MTLEVEGYSREGSQAASYPAEVNGRDFAGQVELFPGVPNTVRAVATTHDGAQVTTAIALYPGTEEEPVTLTPLPPSGVISPQTGSFEVSFEAEVNAAGTIVNYAWDFEGDGRVDQMTSTPSTTFAYSTPGIFYPTVTVTVDTGSGVPSNEPVKGIAYLATTVVNVMSYGEMDALLGAKWAGMKEALTRGEVEKALGNFTESSRESFRQQFTLLYKMLPQIVGEMGTATLVEARDGRAVYDLRTIRDRVVYSFQLEFIREGDGLWRIRCF